MGEQMIGKLIQQYEIIEQLGEVPIRLDVASEAKLCPIAELRLPAATTSYWQAGIPPKGGSWGGCQ